MQYMKIIQLPEGTVGRYQFCVEVLNDKKTYNSYIFVNDKSGKRNLNLGVFIWVNPVTNFLDSSRHSTSLVLLHGKQYGELFLTYGLEIAQNKKILSQVQQPYDIAVQTITIFWNINKEITVSVGFTNEYVKSVKIAVSREDDSKDTKQQKV